MVTYIDYYRRVCKFSLCLRCNCRYAGAPIDFEEIEMNSTTTNPEIMRGALLSVQRNGVAIKGLIFSFLFQNNFKSAILVLPPILGQEIGTG